MAKTIGPLMSVSASGQFAKSITFDKRGFAREYVIPANPQTTDQMTVRNILGDIQRMLKALGLVIRPQVKTDLGYRWNSVILNELMKDNHAIYDAHVATWNAFGSTDKNAWTSDSPAVGLVNTAGGVFYAVAKALYDVDLRAGGDGLITAPVANNSATVAAEWVDNTP